MESIITYILQVNLLLGLLYLGYYFLLKNLTFYTLNRYYFLLGSIYAFLYPFVNFKKLFSSEFLPQVQGEFNNYLPMALQEEGRSWSLSNIILVIFSIIAAVFLIKLVLQLISLYRIYHYSSPAQWQEYYFRNVIFPITPFSFFNKIYLHQEQHEEPELKDIFKHEHIHVKGHHSLDVLWFELVLIVCWYNPFVWFMRKAVRQNLEFLTDQQVLDKGVNKKTYQYSLLQVSKQGVRVGLSNHFNFNILKKRIMMMNKKRSSKIELGKYAFLLPMMIIAGITFTANQAEAKIDQIATVTESFQVDVALPKQFSAQLKVENNDKRYKASKQLSETKGQVNHKKLKIKEVLNISSQDTIKKPIIITTKSDSVKNFKTGYAVNGGKSQYRTYPLGNFYRYIDGVKTEHFKLIIIDGKRMPKGFLLGPHVVKRNMEVTVLNALEAIDYGEDAKNGALIVETKGVIE